MDCAVLISEVLRLPAPERTQIIDALWQSMDTEEQTSIGRAWLSESQDRLNAFRNGKLNAVEATATLDAIEADLRK